MNPRADVSDTREVEDLRLWTTIGGEEILEKAAEDEEKGTSTSPDNTTGGPEADDGDPDEVEIPGGVEVFIRDIKAPELDAESGEVTCWRCEETTASLTGGVTSGYGAAG